MSRNLCDTSCWYCDEGVNQGSVVLIGPIAPITEKQAGCYYEEFKALLVGDAECKDCRAKYLAWMSDIQGNELFDEIGDLSFRSTFNDEPGAADAPKWQLKTVVTRTIEKVPWPTCEDGHPCRYPGSTDCYECRKGERCA